LFDLNFSVYGLVFCRNETKPSRVKIPIIIPLLHSLFIFTYVSRARGEQEARTHFFSTSQEKEVWREVYSQVWQTQAQTYASVQDKTRELNNLLLWYNLRHTVNVPTRITKTTETLLDVVITNEKKSINSLRVMDLGLSDHYAQIISISIPEFSNIPYRIKKRQFSEANVQEFLHLLNQVT